MPTPIVIAEYDPTWPAAYAQMEAEIHDAIGTWIERIEHIGSTSVPGLAAKPVIDVLVGVGDDELIDVTAEPEVVVGAQKDVEPAGPVRHVEMVQALRAIGYVYRSINGIPERLFFKRADVEPGRHIHLVRTDSPFFERHVLFRDYLRAHPAEAAAYAELKRGLAAKHGADRLTYTDAKTAFITACEAKAFAWRDG
ncbi:MAG: GrpB family protein [Planctomycetota bacterium]|nr:GrpB family protein [Planctomycetota bacterium]